jgi:hypothetical protein
MCESALRDVTQYRVIRVESPKLAAATVGLVARPVCILILYLYIEKPIVILCSVLAGIGGTVMASEGGTTGEQEAIHRTHGSYEA